MIGIALDWTWKGSRIPLTLHRLLALDGAGEEELRFVDDMKLSVFHRKNLPKKTRDRFRSDMGFVADYLNEGSFERRRKQRIVHVRALCYTQDRQNLRFRPKWTYMAGGLSL